MASRTEAIHQLKGRVSQLELERTQLQDNVYDAEQAIRTAAKDREYLSIYLKSISAAFEKVNSVHTCYEGFVSLVIYIYIREQTFQTK